MGRFRAAGAIVCAVFLSACAGVPLSPTIAVPVRATLAAFSLEGRFSLRNEDKSYSGRLSWRHQGKNDEVLLSSPLGQGLAEISSGEGGARLTASDGRVYSATDAETLTRDVLGYPLPLAQLADWVRGQGGAAENLGNDEYGRPARLRFDTWRIEYGYDGDDPDAPPSRIFAERAGGSLELRLRIDEWNRIPPEGKQP